MLEGNRDARTLPQMLTPNPSCAERDALKKSLTKSYAKVNGLRVEMEKHKISSDMASSSSSEQQSEDRTQHLQSELEHLQNENRKQLWKTEEQLGESYYYSYPVNSVSNELMFRDTLYRYIHTPLLAVTYSECERITGHDTRLV